MKIVVLAVGRVKAEPLRAACEDYLLRLRRHLPADVVEVRDARRRPGGDVDRWRAEEGEALLSAVPAGGWLVALDERGKAWDTREFASWLQARRDGSVPAVAFAIGGPDGHGEAVRAAARSVWSLSRLTLPHELARLVLLEQLYRAASLLAGSPYHRD